MTHIFLSTPDILQVYYTLSNHSVFWLFQASVPGFQLSQRCLAYNYLLSIYDINHRQPLYGKYNKLPETCKYQD